METQLVRAYRAISNQLSSPGHGIPEATVQKLRRDFETMMAGTHSDRNRVISPLVERVRAQLEQPPRR